VSDQRLLPSVENRLDLFIQFGGRLFDPGLQMKIATFSTPKDSIIEVTSKTISRNLWKCLMDADDDDNDDDDDDDYLTSIRYQILRSSSFTPIWSEEIFHRTNNIELNLTKLGSHASISLPGAWLSLSS
jgi:hypothetical protein